MRLKKKKEQKIIDTKIYFSKINSFFDLDNNNSKSNFNLDLEQKDKRESSSLH